MLGRLKRCWETLKQGLTLKTLKKEGGREGERERERERESKRERDRDRERERREEERDEGGKPSNP